MYQKSNKVWLVMYSHVGSIWIMSCWVMLGHDGSCWVMPGHAGSCQVMSGHAESCQGHVMRVMWNFNQNSMVSTFLLSWSIKEFSVFLKSKPWKSMWEVAIQRGHDLAGMLEWYETFNQYKIWEKVSNMTILSQFWHLWRQRKHILWFWTGFYLESMWVLWVLHKVWIMVMWFLARNTMEEMTLSFTRLAHKIDGVLWKS